MSEVSIDMKELAAALLPGLSAQLKTFVADALPAPVAVPLEATVDAVDAWMIHLLGAGTAPPAVVTTDNTAARLADLERHVAALTLTTQAAGTSSLVDLKAAAAKPADIQTAQAMHAATENKA